MTMRSLTPILIAIVLLAGMTIARSWRPEPEQAEGHHADVRAAVQGVPQRIGEWVGEDMEITQGAVDLLQPNALLKRQYRNAETGEVATLLIVHCKDARDMLGHYPPVCYPSSGWLAKSNSMQRRTIGDRRLTCKEYVFAFDAVDRNSRIVIANLMVLPDGRMTTEMDAVNESASHFETRHWGAGQIQLIVDGSVPPSRRQEIFVELMTPNANVIEAMSKGQSE